MIFPDPPMPEPFDPRFPANRCAITRKTWVDFVLRCRVPSNRKTVALAAARVGNADGTAVRASHATLGRMAGLSETAVQRHMKALENTGLLVVVRRGGGRGKDPSEYRLSRPYDITELPLWLDEHWREIPADAMFAPLRTTAEHPPPATGEDAEHPSQETGENGEHTPPATGETPAGDPAHAAAAPEHPSPAAGEDTEHPPPATGGTGKHRSPATGENREQAPPATGVQPDLPPPATGDEPVDNPGPAGTPTDADRNSHRSDPEYPSLARDNPNTYPTTPNPPVARLGDQLTWPRSGTPSAAGPAPSLLAAAVLDGDATVAGHVDGPAELAAARAALGGSGDAARWRAAARRALADRGRTHPADALVTVVAAELHRRAQTPAHHHPDNVIMNGAS